MGEKTLLTPKQAKKLQAKLAAIDERITIIKSQLLIKPPFAEKLKLKKELKSLKRQRKPIACEMKYTIRYIKTANKVNSDVKLINKYYKGK